MNRFIRWYNRNRKTFWLVVVISIIIISIPQALNQYAKNNKKDVSSSTNNTTTYNNKKYSVISEKNIEDKESVELNDYLKEYGLSKTLNKYSGIEDNSPLSKLIEEYYYD